MPITHADAEVNGVRLHYAAAGDGPLLLLLHGFPEFWYAWRAQIEALAPRFRVVAPDLRGYNRSAKPPAVADYAIPALVADLAGLIEHLGYARAVVVGHDWGGVLAWSLAQAAPERVARLVIINAPHPAIFTREIRGNPDQARASSYIPGFHHPGVDVALAAADFAVLDRVLLAPGRAAGFFDAADCAAYKEAWGMPGALTAMMNYYRANTDPADGALHSPFLERSIAPPTLVIWGEQDTALLPGNLDGLDAYVPDLRIVRIPHATHWVIHEEPAMINMLIDAFAAGEAP
jgi:pimeloyl-ACP methyl ester carboxylesterase